MDTVIQFGADGQALCLHTDAIDLSEVGRLSMRRASNVEFNATTQKWEVTIAGESAPAYSHPSRAECIRWEVEELNRRILAQ